MSTHDLLPPIPQPPYDPTSWRLNARIGWHESTLTDGVEQAPPIGALALAPRPGSGRSLTEDSGSFGGLTPPMNVAIGPDGSIFLLDTKTMELKRFDPCDCEFKTVPCLGGEGGGPRQLRNPHGIGICSGNLFVCDTGDNRDRQTQRENHRVSVFALRGFALRGHWRPPASAWTPPYGNLTAPWEPDDLAFDRYGRAYVPDAANGCIHRFSPAGRWETCLAGFGQARAIAIDCEDRLYVLTDGAPPRVRVVNNDGEPAGEAGRSERLASVFPCAPFVTDAQGNLHLGPPGLQSLAVSTDGTRAYAVGQGSGPGNALIQVVDTMAKAAAAALTILPASARPNTLAVARSTGGDALVLADQTSQQLYAVSLSGPTLLGPVNLAAAPSAVAVSPGGHWAYLLEQDANKSFLQVVDLERLQLGQTVVPSTPLQVGQRSQQLLISASGALLYVPYLGDPTNPNDGGIAVLEIAEEDCADILWRHLEGCPHCDVPNCVVLATIENYAVGFRIEDQTAPPSDPQTDINNHVARIDNRKGRKLLPSTQVLTELIECLLEHGTAGTPGPQGPPGKDGAKGGPGPPGPGLETGLTQIDALSWVHNQPGQPIQVTMLNGQVVPGIVIEFTRDVVVSDIDAEHIFQVTVLEPVAAQRGFLCRCPIRGKVIPVQPTLTGPNLIGSATEVAGPNARGAAFILDERTTTEINTVFEFLRRLKINPDLWVVLRGDFLLDKNGKAIDAEFVRHDFNTGDRPHNDLHGIQGGLFESWFPVRRIEPVVVRPDLNTAPRDALVAVKGIGPAMATRILRARNRTPFRNVEDFRARIKPTDPEWELMKDEIVLPED